MLLWREHQPRWRCLCNQQASKSQKADCSAHLEQGMKLLVFEYLVHYKAVVEIGIVKVGQVLHIFQTVQYGGYSFKGDRKDW